MKPVTIDGTTYRNLREAAAAIGLTRQQLQDRLRNGGRRPPYTAAALVADRRAATRNTARRKRLHAWLSDPARPPLAEWARREGISRQRAQELADEPAFAALLAARRESA